MRTSFFLIVLCTFVIAGCKSTTTAPNASTSSRGPAVGTYFILQDTYTDSTGNVISTDTTKELVVATGVTIDGESDVVEIADSSSAGWSKDTAYFRYLADGDVSAYIEGISGDPSGWFTYPFATQTAATWFSVDTTLPGITIQDTARVVGDGFPQLTDTIHSVIYTFTEVQKITLFESLNHSSGGILLSDSWAETFYYVPPAYYVLETDRPGFRLSGVMQPSFRSHLIGGWNYN
jgi:hypothetical protein